MSKKRKSGMGVKTILLFLCSLFIISVLSISAYAVDIFSDVTSSDYYYEAVQEMANNGYVKGYEDSSFRPHNNITMAESLTILFRLSGYDIPPNSNTEHWYSSVWDESKKIGIVSEFDDPNEYATRLDIAKFIIKLYQIDTSLTNVEGVFMDTNLLVANTMYQYEIFLGSPSMNGGVDFLPNSHISRGDLALVIYRLNDKIRSPYIGSMQVGTTEVNVNPDTLEDYMKIMKTLGESGELSITVPYTKDLSNISYYLKIREAAVEAFERSFSMYPEYFSFTPTLTLKREISDYTSGVITFTLSNINISDEEILRMRGEFYSVCEDIVGELYAYEVITEDTVFLDKVRLFYEYVALHCEYDLTYGVNSFTGYGAAVEGLAVCQGYTAMFNQLCKLGGLDVIAVSGTLIGTNEPHMWSAVYDSENQSWVYCDVTFGDPIRYNNDKDYYDLAYFNIPEEELMIGRVKDWE